MAKIKHLKEDIDSEFNGLKENKNFKWIIYSYQNGGWDGGSGFAVGKIGAKYFYLEMGHCSCYGPTENLSTAIRALHTITEIKKIALNYGEHAKAVIEAVKKIKK